jgi:capsular polysaccharide biosynthesis protein
MNQAPEKEALDFSPLAILLWRSRKIFFIVGFAAIAMATTLSMLMTPMYQSFAVVFPAQSTSLEKNLDGLEFGYEVHAERIIQILESDAVRDSISQKFDLIKRYEIDLSKPDWQDKFHDKFYSNFKFSKSKYKSVVIQVVDSDPIMSAKMANEMLDILNSVHINIFQSHAKQIFEIYKKSLNEHLDKVNKLTEGILELETSERTLAASKYIKELQMRQAKVKSLSDSLDILRSRFQFGNLDNKVEVFESYFAEARRDFLFFDGQLKQLESTPDVPDSTLIRVRSAREGARQSMEYFESQIQGLTSINQKYIFYTNGLGIEEKALSESRIELDRLVLSPNPDLQSRKVNQLVDEYNYAVIELNAIREQYRKALLNYMEPGPVAFSISKASPSWKQISPVIWMNLAIALILSEFLVVVVVVLGDKIKKMKALDNQ